MNKTNICIKVTNPRQEIEYYISKQEEQGWIFRNNQGLGFNGFHWTIDALMRSVLNTNYEVEFIQSCETVTCPHCKGTGKIISVS